MKDTFNPEQRRRLMELAGISVEEVKALDSTGETVHGQELYNILPDVLYHTTSQDVWEKVKKEGYLGFNYKSATLSKQTNWIRKPVGIVNDPDSEFLFGDDIYGDEEFIRSWQKPGWGVFFGTDPNTVPSFTSRKAEVVLSVKKKDLNPKLFYFDGDQYDLFGNDLDLESNLNSVAVFYAGKVPVGLIKVLTKKTNRAISSKQVQEYLSSIKNMMTQTGESYSFEGIMESFYNDHFQVYLVFRFQNYYFWCEIVERNLYITTPDSVESRKAADFLQDYPEFQKLAQMFPTIYGIYRKISYMSMKSDSRLERLWHPANDSDSFLANLDKNPRNRISRY